MKIAPIAVFLFNRPKHAAETLFALSKNVLASESIIYIFLDAPACEEDRQKSTAIKSYINSISGFAKIILIERDYNFGLAKNITEGISYVLERHDRVIVIEDDIITSPAFLSYMNQALTWYANESKIWHISGFNDPIQHNCSDERTFLWRVMNCWGWATWRDRWEHYLKDPKRLISDFDEATIRRFDLDGTQDFWAQIIRNYNGDLNTWAVFWYATIFKNNGLCLNPVVSYIKNIGFDGSGQNCKIDTRLNKFVRLNMCYKPIFQNTMKEDEEIVSLLKKYYSMKNTPLGRILRVARRKFPRWRWLFR